MNSSICSADAVRRALSIRDLTDPSAGPHAMQHVVEGCTLALSSAWGCEARVRRASPIVSIADNYDALRYPRDGVARDARYTRYVCDTALLRTQTSAMVPPLLRELAGAPGLDVLLACPGLVYRRDRIDRLHTGEPHQLDLWRVRRGRPLARADLRAMIALVVGASLPDREWRIVPAVHPYTLEGRQIDVRSGSEWVEIGECGLAHPEVLAASGLDPGTSSGLAMGLGLDRIVMLRKGVGDIRLLRSEEPRVASQMKDLAPYRPVSSMPPVRRDLSIVVAEAVTEEELGDRVRAALGDRAGSIESIEVLVETACAALPPAARTRLGIRDDQKNVLLRIVVRDLGRTLTHAEANEIRDAVYAAVHEGPMTEWASDTERARLRP
jgi:phenylalanyl-tRNA synthetase alpha chain